MKEKYYSGFKVNNNEQWLFLLELSTKIANAVEFNIFLNNYSKEIDIQPILKDKILIGKRKNKIYSNGNFIRFNLTENVLNFIKSKDYNSWKNYSLSDISLLKNGKEIMATISHHDEIILLLTPKEREGLIKKGFDFWCEWKP